MALTARRLSWFFGALAVVVPVWLALAVAPAAATTFSNPAGITLNDPNSQSNGNNNATATPYPATIAVSGLTGTVSNVTMSLTNVSFPFSQDIDVLLVGPGGQTLIPIAAVGPNSGGGAAASNSTLTLSDAGSLPGDQTAWGSSSTFKPVNYGEPPTVNGFNEVWESPAPAPPYGDPGQSGTGATFASQFNGTNPNGTWSLYVITTAGGDGTGAIAGGWSLNITTASAAATTTTIGSNNNPSFTSGTGSSVTLTATVEKSSDSSNVGEGTVAFTDGGTTIAGCGAQAVSAGQATCTTTFSSEGSHSLEAQYGGTANFGASSATLTQQVDNHTTQTGNNFCNTGNIALNNPPVTVADASPYPSHVFVSGSSGAVSHLTVSLNNVTYAESQDIDALLVGPAGQSFILTADAGPNSGGGLSNVSLTLDDLAASTIAANQTWGAANANVTSKPFNYGGFNETWGPPAPAGPYGNPGPSGGGTDTLGSTFNGSSANGTWSLYVITTAAGDGTGAIAGGWCANITTANVPATTTTLASGNNPSFTAAPNNSVTLTATVTKSSDSSNVSEGTIDFTDAGATIAGCGAVAVSAGQATCTTTFTSEGPHSLKAQYSGTANFGASNATLTQQVDDHTTQTGGNYCNNGSIALNNPPSTVADATPYPSHIFISGVPGTLAHLAVALKGVTYSESQDIDALLVGPGGQTLILTAAAGPNSGGALSNVTLTLDDAALSTIAATQTWGAPSSNVTSKPFNYGGVNETWGAPAPPGPYGNPGPSGGGTATLGGTFNGTNPSGTWSLYVITTAAGDGTGAIGGGWCLNTTVNKAPLTMSTQVSSTPIQAGASSSDTATLAGIPNGATAPTGSVTFNLYGPNDPTCTAAPVFTSAVALTGSGVTTSSGPFTPTSVGTYQWTASYAGDSNYTSAPDACGATNESVVVNQATPAISTTASASVAAGGTISDSATLTGGAAPTGTITFKVYGPDDATCANAAAFTSAATVAGNGNYASGNFTAAAAGTYRWIASYGGDANNAAVSGPCNDTNESVVVTKASPAVATTASASVAAGGSISDSAALSGGTGPTGTITFTLFGPDNASCTGTPIFTSTEPVSGNANYGSGNFTAAAAGTYRFIAAYSGDANNSAAITACGDAGESVVVTKATTAIVTTASGSVAVGGQISDSATLSGGAAPTGSITFNVYGPNDASCANPPAFTSTTSVSSGNGAYGSGNFTPTAAGTYRFIASYGGDANNATATTACGDAGESVVVTKATTAIVTTASASVAVGGQISDSATLSGGDSPTGTITFTLFGPSNATCTGAPIFTSTKPVSGNASYGSDNFTTAAPGTYAWVASYSGDANNTGATTACNDANESVVVTKAAPSIATTASGPVAVSGQISDTATLSNGTAPTGTITFTLFGPNNATCAGAAIFTSTVAVNGNGSYGSASFTTAAVGTYRFIAAYSGDSNNAAATTACGDVGESVAVGQASPVISTTASGSVAAGGQISDSAKLAGGTAPTGTITFKVYGPNNATCANAAAFTSTTSVSSGNGTYGSGNFAAAAAGTYRWVAAYGGDANNTAASTA